MMPRVTVAQSIQTKLTEALAPVHLQVENESHMHSVPPGSETHFKVLVVSGAFEGLGPAERHRKVYEALRDELARGVHALTMRTLTPQQWEAQGAAGFESPACLGGSKSG
jgi:BolA protein